MMNRRDFLRSFALTGGLWVLGESAGPTFAAVDKGTLEWPNHPFLQGNFAPVQGETTADNLKVIGTLPPEMEGMFIRNGPNPQFPPLGNYHWFFGDGMLHGVRVQGGKASCGKIRHMLRGTPPPKLQGRVDQPPATASADTACSTT